LIHFIAILNIYLKKQHSKGATLKHGNHYTIVCKGYIIHTSSGGSGLLCLICLEGIQINEFKFQVVVAFFGFADFRFAPIGFADFRFAPIGFADFRFAPIQIVSLTY